MSVRRAVIFDLGNVLVRFSHARMRAQLAGATGLAEREIAAFLAEDRRLLDYERGAVDDSAMLAALARRAGRPLDAAATLHALSDIFEPLPEMLALVHELKAAGVRLGMLSNTVPPHIAHLRQRWPEVFAPFNAVTLSYEARAAKPEPAIYAAALRDLGVPPGQAWFVDDLPENIAGAQALGLRGTLFVGHDALRTEFRAAGWLP